MLEVLKERKETIDTYATVSKCGTGEKQSIKSDNPTLRNQHEMKVRPPNGPPIEKSDLVLLKSNITLQLQRARNGALDVIAPVHIHCIDAVVELKAACSADPEQRHLFRLDVEKLQTVLKNTPADQQIEVHFVLVDKSLPVGLHITHDTRSAATPIWQRGTPGARRIKIKVDKKAILFDEKSPQLVLRESRGKERLVNVWDLDCDLNPRHRVCEAIEVPDVDALGILKKAK